MFVINTWCIKDEKGRKMAKTGENIRKTKLTDKQEKFCYEYVLHLNATRAAINAGYSPRTAGVIGFENLKKPNIQERISHMQENLAETAQISALRIAKEHEKLAFSTIANLHNTWIELVEFEALTEGEKACIKSISTKTLKKNIGTNEEPEIIDVEFVKLELYDKQRSLDSLNRMFGNEAPIKQEITASGINIKFVNHGRDED